MKLTVDMITKRTSNRIKKRRDEDVYEYLQRLTHLYLEDCNIDDVGDVLSSCRNLLVLYLYDNTLSVIPCLNRHASLTQLYLQNNCISQLCNLSSLPKLSKLYVGGNCISVVEGLEKLKCLQELHLENQRLPAGEKLLFDPRSMENLQDCLEVLNISGNGLTTLNDLTPLNRLTQLWATDNCIAQIKDIASVLPLWRQLSRLDMNNNQLCQKSKYRDHVILLSPSLGILDGKEICETERLFIQKWHANKLLRDRLQKQQSLSGHQHFINILRKTWPLSNLS